jgi:dihydroorotate dehydrogenase
MYSLIKPLLFSVDAETVHDFAMKISSLSPALGSLGGIPLDERLMTQVGSCTWTFPVGLAAGLDKNADSLEFFSRQGFGAVECGTVTLQPQDGNPKPRVFRYPEEESLRNAMGFPNRGFMAMDAKLRAFEGRTPIGVNMGKNKETSAEESINELALIYETLTDHGDYFVVNVSSPNTPGLRAFQEVSYLTELFSELKKLQAIYHKDLYLKIAPDLEAAKVRELAQFVEAQKLTGLIATNTTIKPELGTGGVSGKLLTKKAHEIHELILAEDLSSELIGVGGFSHPTDLFRYWGLGGKAIQIYSAYVFQGPALLRNFKTAIHSFLETNQLTSLQSFFDLPKSERIKCVKDYPAYSVE